MQNYCLSYPGLEPAEHHNLAIAAFVHFFGKEMLNNYTERLKVLKCSLQDIFLPPRG
jgi:hypothetical protein